MTDSAGKIESANANSASLQDEFERALACYQRGQVAEAEQICRSILQAEAEHFEATHLLGTIFLQRGQAEKAERQLSLAIQINSNVAAAHNNRGNALTELRLLDEAIASYDRAVALKPDYAEAFNNRGRALRKLTRLVDALASCDKAVALKPDYAEAFYNRGKVLEEVKRFVESLASYGKAIALEPNYAKAFCAQGVVLVKLNWPDKALASYGKAIARKPDYAEAFYNRGIALTRLNRLSEACVDFETALAFKPNLNYVEDTLILTKMSMCDWKNLEMEWSHLISGVRNMARVSDPFVILTTPSSSADQLQCSKVYVADHCPPSVQPYWQGQRYAHDRIRIAYLSADFRRHPIAHLTAELFELHDRSQFKVVGVSFGHNDQSDMRRRLVRAFDQFHDVCATSDRDVAKILSDLEVDIAINLTYETRPAILSYRPAPISVAYCYPGTMGADFIDYIIADKIVAPFDQQACYAEKIVHLPECYLVYDTRGKIAGRTPTRGEVGLPEEGFVFCCFNSNVKITERVFSIWMRLLKNVPGSVLWLLRDNADVEQNLRFEAKKRRINPERLIFVERVERDGYLARYRLADLFLDTLPYNAHTTACDSLWVGLPVLTCLGSTFAGRVAGSLLSAIGLSELITRGLEEYEALALKLARNPILLVSIKEKLARNRNTYSLFNTQRTTLHIEAAYRIMWERYQRGEPPASFAVDPIVCPNRM